MSDELPKPTDPMYFAGQIVHGLVLWVRFEGGRKKALRLIKHLRLVARLYAKGAPGFSLRPDEDFASLARGARPSALLLLALLAKLEEEVRKS